ncbi:MAG: hypothetical protein RIR73_2350 [Chloroflexota bacterium]
MSRGVKIAIGIVIVMICLCGAGMLFVNWANSDEGQAAMNEVSTQQAIESATAAVEATAQAQAQANTNATATAVIATINDRMQNLTLVYENTFEEGTPLVNEFGEDLDPYYRDDIPEVIVPWNGSTILFSNLNLTDFVAEVDCANNGTYCGIAYNYKAKAEGEKFSKYFASGIGAADTFFFDDLYASLPSFNWDRKDFDPSPADGFLHRVRVERFGQVMRLYVNGELMEERLLTNPEIVSGDVGFLFGKASDESGIQTVQFDNFRVWKLP